MRKRSPKRAVKPSPVSSFLKDLDLVFSQPVKKAQAPLVVAEYPFDAQLLSLSPLYRQSRKLYISIGGQFAPRVCSTMRSLSSQDLFKNQIEYSPLLSEMLWFKDHSSEVVDPEVLMNAMSCYNEISLFHEQNHRIIWQLMPTAPREERDFCRYLNFAESLVVTLDLALGDDLGPKLSPVFERLKAIYRPGGEDKWFGSSKKEYRQYLHAVLFVTYMILELIDPRDIPAALAYVVPDLKKRNADALKRGLELSELFTMNTNRQWQQRYWKQAQERLAQVHENSPEDPLYLPEDPLDFEEEFVIANRIFDYYGL